MIIMQGCIINCSLLMRKEGIDCPSFAFRTHSRSFPCGRGNAGRTIRCFLRQDKGPLSSQLLSNILGKFLKNLRRHVEKVRAVRLSERERSCFAALAPLHRVGALRCLHHHFPNASLRLAPFFSKTSRRDPE